MNGTPGAGGTPGQPPAAGAAAGGTAPPGAPLSPFRPAGSLAVALRIVFTAWLVLEAYALGALVVLYRVIDAQAANPFAYAGATLEDQIGLWDSLSWVEILFLAVIAFLFVAWTFRVYGNLPAIGARGKRYRRGWAIGGWLIPFANLVIPKQIVDDAWRSSDPEWSNPDDATWARPSWHLVAVDRRVHLWWGTFLVGRVMLVFANSGIERAQAPGQIRISVAIGIAAVLLQMVAAVLSMWLVAEIPARQAARARSMGRAVADRDATRWMARQVQAVPVLVVAIAAAGYLVFDPGPPLGTVGTATTGGAMRYDGHGISFEYDPGFTATETGVFGDEAADYGGVVFLAGDDATTFAFVTWIAAPGTGVDAEEMVDGTIDGGAEGYGPGARTTRSRALTLAGGPTTFVAKTFTVDGDLGLGGGAVASGACAGDDRQVTIMHAVEGHIDAVPAGSEHEHPSILVIEGILATLDC